MSEDLDKHVYLPIIVKESGGSDDGGDEFSQEITLMPVYNVIRNSTSEVTGQRLANALQLPVNPFDHDGVLRYMDQERFQYIPQTFLGEGEPDEEGKPTALYATNMEALRETTVIGDEEAIALANDALEEAELSYFGASSHIRAIPAVDHSRFFAHAVDGSEEFTILLDTQVLYDFTLDDIPLFGPGSKVKLVFDGEGVATQVFYTMRDIQPGEMVPIIPVAEGDQLCRDAFLSSVGDSEEILTLRTWSRLVYYAPELGMTSVTRIFPQYICGGKAVMNNPGEEESIEYEMPTTFVPAIEDIPQVSLSVVSQGGSDRRPSRGEGAHHPIATPGLLPLHP